jgi:hypothetical protein
MAQNKHPTSRRQPILDVQAPTAAARREVKKPRSALWWRAILQPKNRKWMVLALTLLVLAACFFVRNYTKTRSELMLRDPTKLAAHVGTFLELPSDETPTLAAVREASKLRTQAFFKNAQDGDKVLIYAKAGKAVLYRPDTKKVIEFATISLESNAKPPGQ